MNAAASPAVPRRVGVVGLGAMGLPVVGHLLRGGYEVLAWDVDRDRVSEALAAGAGTRPTLGEVAGDTDGTIVAVGTEAQVEAVCRDIIGGAREGHTIVVCSTIRPSAVGALERLAAGPAGCHVLDAPVCRGEVDAQRGTLLALCGAEPAVHRHWEPVLRAFCSDVVRLGGPGAGQIGKMLNNALLWSAIAANTEILQLGMRLGLDQAALRDALSLSSGANWALDTWDRDRPMPWAEKDLEILLESGRAAGLELPLAERVAAALGRIKGEKARIEPHPGSSMAAFLEQREGRRPQRG